MSVVDTMERNEQLLLLQLILEDIRGGWASYVAERLTCALRLAQITELPQHIATIEDALRDQRDDAFDGRFFRMSWDMGGYSDGEQAHGLTHTIMDRSQAFQICANTFMDNPSFLFTDWDDYLVQLIGDDKGHE